MGQPGAAKSPWGTGLPQPQHQRVAVPRRAPTPPVLHSVAVQVELIRADDPDVAPLADILNMSTLSPTSERGRSGRVQGCTFRRHRPSTAPFGHKQPSPPAARTPQRPQSHKRKNPAASAARVQMLEQEMIISEIREIAQLVGGADFDVAWDLTCKGGPLAALSSLKQRARACHRELEWLRDLQTPRGLARRHHADVATEAPIVRPQLPLKHRRALSAGAPEPTISHNPRKLGAGFSGSPSSPLTARNRQHRPGFRGSSAGFPTSGLRGGGGGIVLSSLVRAHAPSPDAGNLSVFAFGLESPSRR